MKNFEQEKIIFIIAPDRAGTTLLQNIMSSFSKCCNNEESRISGSDSPSCWDFVRKFDDFSYLEKFILSKWKSEFFIEKSPPSIMCLPQISTRYPNAKFIFLKRSPQKILLSQLNLHIGLSEIGKRKEDLDKLIAKPGKIITRWERIMAKRLLRMIKLQLAYKKNFKNHIEIKYEDLIESPDKQLKLIGEKFGLKPNFEKAHEIINKPSSSTTFRYGIKKLSDKISKDIVLSTCKEWDYKVELLV